MTRILKKSALFLALLSSIASAAPTAARYDSTTLSGLGVRNIGSAAMSGRVSALAAYVEDGKTILYVGAASGGVWKSRDGGTSFEPMFDKQTAQSIGAITVDPSNKNTIWVGTGESWVRNSVSVGDGIYKSTDGGQSWKNMGLKNSERINKIVVHPSNSQIVYACVPGKLWSDSNDRGLYQSMDGGESWKQIIKGANASTGCSALTLDPTNPDVMIAGMWDFRRAGWTFRSGGAGPTDKSGSAMLKTTDGGKTWAPMTAENTPGLPAGPWGRIEVEVAPSDNKIVYAFVEGTSSALYRSADAGKTFERRDDSQMMVWRPFYFANLIVDPKNPDRLFKNDLNLIASEDGGKSFSGAGGGCHGDWHDVWIDPNNTQHTVAANDGGLCVSHDGGSRWHMMMNLPISQFYHVSVDNQDPYKVYGGLQDNSSWSAESSYPGGVSTDRWQNMFGGDGFWVVTERDNPNVIYAESQGGNIGRIDAVTKSTRDIQPKAQAGEKLRFNWNTPLHISPNDGKTLYIGAQVLFRSRDRGDSWERISGDLTTNDKAKQRQEESGGITVDNSSAEMHTTIYSIAEQKGDAETVWVGTDDGNVQLTRDGGKNWTNVVRNIRGLAKGSWVSAINLGNSPGEAFITFDRHTVGDMEPYAYVTRDFGASFSRVASASQGVRGYAHVLKQDPEKSNVLYLGTEFGLWISIDSGARWAEFKANDFPSVAVRDMDFQTRDHDLVLATHGRGIWIIDDLTPLRALTDEILAKDFSVLPARAVQQRMGGVGGWSPGDAIFIGENPQGGAIITYFQKSRHLFGKMVIEVLDSAGTVIDTVPAGKRAGINRVSWAGRVKPPTVPKAAQAAFAGTQGPRVLPGTYTVRITKAGQSYEQKIDIGLDRRATYTLADRQAQFDAAMQVHALFGEMSKVTSAIERMAMLGQFAPKMFPAGAPELKQIATLISDAQNIRKNIVATKEGGAITGEERLREHTDQLYSAILGYEGKPGQYQLDRIVVLRDELKAVQAEFGALMQKNAPLMETVKGKMQGMPMGMQREWNAPNDGPQVVFSTDAIGRLKVVVESKEIAAETD
jgi:photosystem II stability/assembly factor-like uncharacterized protein